MIGGGSHHEVTKVTKQCILQTLLKRNNPLLERTAAAV